MADSNASRPDAADADLNGSVARALDFLAVKAKEVAQVSDLFGPGPYERYSFDG